MSDSADAWTRMYESEIGFARHHEVMRTHTTNVVTAISVALLAFASSKGISSASQLLAGALLVVANTHGAVAGLKHYERSQRHFLIARRYRAYISKDRTDGQLASARSSATSEHGRRFAHMTKIRAHWLWCGLHGVLLGAGVFLAITNVQATLEFCRALE